MLNWYWFCGIMVVYTTVCVGDYMWNIKETACLSGHRPNKLPWFYDETKASCIKFKQDLQKLFIGAYEYGLKNYLVGMAEGFDMIGAETLIELRRTYKDIKIFAIIPCKSQEKKWTVTESVKNAPGYSPLSFFRVSEN